MDFCAICIILAKSLSVRILISHAQAIKSLSLRVHFAVREHTNNFNVTFQAVLERQITAMFDSLVYLANVSRVLVLTAI